MIVGQLRGDVGHCVVDGNLLELGESSQRQFTAFRSFVRKGVSADFVTDDGRDDEPVGPKSRLEERRAIRPG
jgi:hypothetical protein